ncbi:MAG TPA: hypothetical protein DD426_12170 [Clostridiaceae bacterium]|nr:hypothetical protein [Clostridiaceae bacterium]
MNQMFKKVTAVFITVSMFTALFAGCSAKKDDKQSSLPPSTQDGNVPTLEEDAKNPVKFSIFVGEGKFPKGNEPVLQEITKKTGVSFDIQSVASNAKDKLSIMLASKDFPEIIMMGRDDLFYRYLDSGELVDLKPLLQKNAPKMYQILSLPGNGELTKRFEQNGKLLYLTQDAEMLRQGEKPFEDLEDPNFVERELPWHRALYVLYPEIQNIYGKKINNLDDLYTALKAYKAKYNDKNHYPISMSSTMGEHMIWAAASMYGYKVLSYGIYGGIYATKDGKNYQYTFKLPEMLNFFKFLNKLYREGLMDEEGPIQNDDQFQQKMNGGKVFSMIGNWDSIYTANSTLLSNAATKDEIFIPQKLMAPGVDKVWQFNYAYTGNNAMVVTKKCKDPARFARFLEALYTNDDVQVLNGWGIQGQDYIIKDGKRDISADIQAKMEADPDYGLKRGLNFFNNVINILGYASDGQPASNWNAPFYQSDEGQDPRDKTVTGSPLNWHNDWAGTFYKDYDELDIYMKADSPEARGLAQSQTLVNDAVSKMVLAGSEAEVEQIYKETIQQMETNGISAWEKALNKEISDRRNINK